MPPLGVSVPLVSIIIPCFNARDSIVETVHSALAQVSVRTEVIVVDDGSTDGTRDALVAAGLLDQIRFDAQANQGVSVARNRGIDLSSGDYLCFLDSDDLLKPTFAREMIDALEDEGVRIGYCDYRYFLDTPERPTLPLRYPIYSGAVQGHIISEHFVPTTGVVLLTREAMGTTRFDPALRNAQDWLFWAQILMHERVCFHPTVLIDIRYRMASLSRTRRKRDRAVINVLDRIEPLLASCRPALTSHDLGQFYYRYATALIDTREFGRAGAMLRRCIGCHPGARTLVNLGAKFTLELLHLRWATERLLWRLRLRRGAREAAAAAAVTTTARPRASVRHWPRPVQAFMTVVITLLQWL